MTERTERRQNPPLTPAQIEQIIEDIGEQIAEKAAEKALAKMEEKLYQQVGKHFVSKLLQFTGLVLLSIAYYLNSKGLFKIG